MAQRTHCPHTLDIFLTFTLISLPISHLNPSKTVLLASVPSHQPPVLIHHHLHEDKPPSYLHPISSAPAFPPAFSIPCSSPRKKPSWHKTNWTFYVKDEDLPFRPNMWWRWGESNSRPKVLSYRLLRAQFMFKLQIWADTNNRRPSYPGKISHSALQESGIRYPAIGPLFPQAGAK